jgi:predicted dehydrogenase/threonine dehydrogenase-like Zn-dependent dehydrogenase
MKQVLQHARTGEITVEEVPAPQLLPGCLLVRIAASVVSAGTERASSEFARKSLLQKAKSRPDLVRDVISKAQREGILSAIHAVRSRLDQPQPPGYSSAGTVIGVGEGVTDIQPGDRVACAGAGYAVHSEIACIPRLLAARIPMGGPRNGADVPFDEAAFATLGAVALHGVRTSQAEIGDVVGVIGLGLMGQITTQLLKAAGCRVVGMDIDDSRTALARDLGADLVASSTSVFRDMCTEISRGAGVDSVIITAETPSSEPVNLAGAVARDRAIVVAVGTVGMEIERKAYYEKELDFRISRSYGPGRYDSVYEQKGRDYPIGYVRWTENRNMEAFLQLVAERKIDMGALITHRFPIEEAARAYELITGRVRQRYLGVVIQYSEDVKESATLVLVQEKRGESVKAVLPVTEVVVGVLGAGGFASSTLIPAIKALSNSALLTVCAATGSHAQHAATEFGFQSSTTNENDVFFSPKINTVVVATRHHLHARQVLAALSAGKNVFCEKPLCLSEEELYSISRAYFHLEPAQRPAFMVGFNRRFAPMTKRMKSFLSSTSEPLALQCRVNAGHLPKDHWINDREQGGGRVLGEVCHFVDLLMFLAGSPIVEVESRAIGGSPRYSGDNVLVSLRFGNGSVGSISYLANGDRAYSKERIEVFGGGCAAVLDDFRKLELVRGGRKQKIHSRWRQDKGHRAEWEAFARSIVDSNAPPAIRFEEIVCATLATLGIEKSLATGANTKVETGAFLDEILQASKLRPNLDE